MKDFISHVIAVLYRNLIWSYRSPFRLLDVTLWPLWMVFMLSVFLSVVDADPSYLALIIVSVAGWRAIFFVGFETTVMVLEEHWHDALPDILVSPISALQLALGGALTGVLKSIAVVIMFLAVGYLAFGIELADFATFLIALFFLMLAGFSFGFVLFGMAAVFDKRNVFTLSFMLPEVIGVASGPYYNIADVFPPCMVSVLNTFPTTHAFNLIKSIFGITQPDYFMLVITSMVWLCLAIVLNRTLYDFGRRMGTLTKVG